MASEAVTKIHVSQGRHSLYLPSSLVLDSAFPFRPKEDNLRVRIQGAKLVVERA